MRPVDLPEGQRWCGGCGQVYPEADGGVHSSHVVEPRELSPGFWVAIDVEEDIEHARARFGVPAPAAAD